MVKTPTGGRSRMQWPLLRPDQKGLHTSVHTIAAMTSMAPRMFRRRNYYKLWLATDPMMPSRIPFGVLFADDPLRAPWLLGTGAFHALKAPMRRRPDLLKNQLIRYQQPACDKLSMNQITELVTRPELRRTKPATLNVPPQRTCKSRDDMRTSCCS